MEIWTCPHLLHSPLSSLSNRAKMKSFTIKTIPNVNSQHNLATTLYYVPVTSGLCVLLNQSINQSIKPSINQSINQTINRSINQSINQTINQTINQSINQSIESGYVMIQWIHGCVFVWRLSSQWRWLFVSGDCSWNVFPLLAGNNHWK